jgi:hypothetical protein
MQATRGRTQPGRSRLSENRLPRKRHTGMGLGGEAGHEGALYARSDPIGSPRLL